jgi:hypothetical protein
MALSADDRVEIYEVVALHGHLVDAGAFERLSEVFTEDVVYDLRPLGGGLLEGIDAMASAARALGDDNPLGHHVTNTIVIAGEDDLATVHAKGIAVRADGTTGTVVYEDVVRRTRAGWRIARRTVIPRRRALRRGGG